MQVRSISVPSCLDFSMLASEAVGGGGILLRKVETAFNKVIGMDTYRYLPMFKPK